MYLSSREMEYHTMTTTRTRARARSFQSARYMHRGVEDRGRQGESQAVFSFVNPGFLPPHSTADPVSGLVLSLERGWYPSIPAVRIRRVFLALSVTLYHPCGGPKLLLRMTAGPSSMGDPLDNTHEICWSCFSADSRVPGEKCHPGCLGPPRRQESQVSV